MSSLRLGTLETHRAGPLLRVKGQGSASGCLCFLPGTQGTALGVLARLFLLGKSTLELAEKPILSGSEPYGLWPPLAPMSGPAWPGWDPRAWRLAASFPAHTLLSSFFPCIAVTCLLSWELLCAFEDCDGVLFNLFYLSEPQFPHLYGHNNHIKGLQWESVLFKIKHLARCLTQKTLHKL